MKRNLHLAAVMLATLAAAACTTLTVDLPPVTGDPTGMRHSGKIIWRDLLTNDPAASQAFYEGLFGWEFEPVGSASGLRADSTYTLIRHNGRLIGGMVDTVALNGRKDISQWIVLMSVPDVDVALDTVRAEGGKVIAGPRDLSRRGVVAVASDAEGAIFGLLQTRDGDPADVEARPGDFLWDELWTTDVEGMAGFYGKLGDLQAAEPKLEVVNAYRVLSSGDRPRVGIMAAPLPDLKPVWMSYLRVTDPAAVTSRVEEFGGRVIVEAQSRPAGGRVAVVAGPSGAGIALQTWPLDKE